MSAVRAVHLIPQAMESQAIASRPDVLPPSSGVSCTEKRLFERARCLAAEFPTAGLRPIALIRVDELDERAGGRVWLALEALQATGSFKVRGALLALDELRRQGHVAVVTASAGNHGAGVAHAARVLGMQAFVFVPSGTPQKKRRRIERGARLVVASSPHYDAAEREARQYAAKMKLPFVSAYEDAAVAIGNGGSIACEIVAELGRVPSRVIVPVGGGGLASGLGVALHEERARTGMEGSLRIFGVQSEASPALALSLEQGRAVETLELDHPTLAEGLEGGISQGAFDRVRAILAGVIVVGEEAIARTMVGLHTAIGLYVEGSGAIAMAPLLERLPPELAPPPHDAAGDDVVVILTGGNVDEDRFDALRERYGDVKLW